MGKGKKNWGIKPRLKWSKTPQRLKHFAFGVRLRWVDSTRRFRIEQFPNATARFVAMQIIENKSVLLGNFSTLNFAKRACDNVAPTNREATLF